MQRPLLTQHSKVEDGGGASELARREEEEGSMEGEEKKGPSGLFIRKMDKD